MGKGERHGKGIKGLKPKRDLKVLSFGILQLVFQKMDS